VDAGRDGEACGDAAGAEDAWLRPPFDAVERLRCLRGAMTVGELAGVSAAMAVCAVRGEGRRTRRADSNERARSTRSLA
jgi:hypothetical protein